MHSLEKWLNICSKLECVNTILSTRCSWQVKLAFCLILVILVLHLVLLTILFLKFLAPMTPSLLVFLLLFWPHLLLFLLWILFLLPFFKCLSHIFPLYTFYLGILITVNSVSLPQTSIIELPTRHLHLGVLEILQLKNSKLSSSFLPAPSPSSSGCILDFSVSLSVHIQWDINSCWLCIQSMLESLPFPLSLLSLL